MGGQPLLQSDILPSDNKTSLNRINVSTKAKVKQQLSTYHSIPGIENKEMGDESMSLEGSPCDNSFIEEVHSEKNYNLFSAMNLIIFAFLLAVLASECIWGMPESVLPSDTNINDHVDIDPSPAPYENRSTNINTLVDINPLPAPYEKTSSLPDICEATVMIVRHCEKGNETSHCTSIGYERALFLATLFGYDESSRWPSPEYIYAMGKSRKHHNNYREIETVTPLSEKFGLKIKKNFDIRDEKKIAKEILKRINKKGGSGMCGKLIVVCWKHSKIPKLANYLGCDVEQGCPEEYPVTSFDQAWELSFTRELSDGLLLGKTKKEIEKEWKVIGNVVEEGFDPLHFSKMERVQSSSLDHDRI